MKLLHLWLPAALLITGLSSHSRAADVWSGSLIPFRPSACCDVSSAAADVQNVPAERSGWFRLTASPSVIFRAQSDDAVPTPPDAAAPAGSGPAAGDAVPPVELPEPSTWNAFSPPLTPDPFLDGSMGQPGIPGAVPPGTVGPPGAPIVTPGANGGRPYRFGLEQRIDGWVLPNASASGGGATGRLDEVGTNYDLVHTAPYLPGWIVRKTFQFRYRGWNGPLGGGGLPGSAFRFGDDFEIQTPAGGPYSMSFGITPSINTDMNRSMTWKAFQLDGRGIIWTQLDPYWSLGLGAMYWDRVDNRVLPYGGLVYRDDYWEWRLTFPEAEVRLFLGNEYLWSKWIYFRGRYNIEAYEGVGAGGVQGEFEIEDWQLTLGLQMDAGYYRWFIENGIVLDRTIDFQAAPDIRIATSYIARIGFRY